MENQLPVDMLQEALSAILRIRGAYARHQHRISNVEYNVTNEAGTRIYSVKGTSKNGESGYFSLVRDVISDVRFLPRYNEEIKAWQPGGFLDAAMSFANELCAQNDKGDSIVLEGHSLGGVVALIGGDILLRRGFNVRLIQTFGSPGSGKLTHVNRDNARCFKNGWDVVTEVPPGYFRLPKIQIGKGKRSAIQDHFLDSYESSVLKMIQLRG